MDHKRIRKGVRAASFCLALALVLMALPVLSGSAAEGDPSLDYSKIESKTNNRWEYYFLRTVMSISIKDAYDTGVLASITAGQAVYEGGVGAYPISIIAQNHFGIKAYSNWTGKVFEQYSELLYKSYADAKLVDPNGSFWRAYDTLDEGIADHSALFHGESKYIPVLEAKDYKEAAYAIQASGYAGSTTTYAGKLIDFIEKFNFQQMDEVTADENGVHGMIMDLSRARLDVGEELTLTAAAYPAPEEDVELDIVWTSDRPEVATVDQTGKVTAVRQGYTLITAVYNGKEAACVIEVDANAYSLERNAPYIYTKPDAASNTLGKLSPGQPVKINSKELFYGPDGTAFYSVSASPNSKDGQPVSGYVRAAGLYTGDSLRLAVGTDQTVLYTGVGDSMTIPLTVYAEELQGKPIAWSSSNTEVVTVDDEGKIACVSEGIAVISVRIDGQLALTVTVYVGSSALKTLVATDSVNLRTKPSTSGSSVLGVVYKGQEVKLINDLGNGWYRILAVIGGHMMEGYSSASYFKEANSGTTNPDPGTPPTTPPEDPTPPPNPGGDIPSVTYQKGKVTVDSGSYLNVRSEASTSGKVVAKLQNNTEVVILETVNTSSSSYPVWYRIRFEYEGETTVGYAAKDFITVTGTVTEASPDELSSVYGIEDEYIISIAPETTLADFRGNCKKTVRVYRPDGKELSAGDVLHSGDTVCVYEGNKVSYVRLAAVVGDADGNGVVNALDYMVVKRAVLGTFSLTGAKERAACITGKKSVGANDYMLLKRAVMGTFSLT
ncbi:MAG: SH3 domain-containing protein [Oscillospiraceae bacterium]|nr:SH3 domain-containing protein [Oscillospiraceae bacterium]